MKLNVVQLNSARRSLLFEMESCQLEKREFGGIGAFGGLEFKVHCREKEGKQNSRDHYASVYCTGNEMIEDEGCRISTLLAYARASVFCERSCELG